MTWAAPRRHTSSGTRSALASAEDAPALRIPVSALEGSGLALAGAGEGFGFGAGALPAAVLRCEEIERGSGRRLVQDKALSQ